MEKLKLLHQDGVQRSSENQVYLDLEVLYEDKRSLSTLYNNFRRIKTDKQNGVDLSPIETEIFELFTEMSLNQAKSHYDWTDVENRDLIEKFKTVMADGRPRDALHEII